MRALETVLDKNGNPIIGILTSDYVDIKVLEAGVAEIYTIPVGAKYVLFSGTDDFYIKFNGAATVPSADVTDGTGVVLNPGLRGLDRVITLGIISETSCVVTMEFFS